MKLDKYQKPAVESEEKNILVVAAAGSGKTTLIVERVRYLVDVKKVDTSSIVCITFTNMAAQEMRTRLSDVEGIGDAFIGTIHSFANRIYKQSNLKYSLLTIDAQIDLYKEILQKNPMDYPYLTLNDYVSYLDEKRKYEMGELDIEDIQPQVYFTPSQYKDYKEVTKIFHSLCEARNIISFDTLLEKTRDYYATLDASIDYVLVDEFQDVGLLEAKFVSGLNAENTFLVGDDWQGIYGFKGADVNIFKNVARDKNTKVYKLSNNYRSAKEIINFGNTIIEQVPTRIEKEVHPISKAKGYVKIDRKQNVDSYIRAIKKSGDYKDWFVLCRSNKDVNELANKMSKEGVPYTTFKRSGMTAVDIDNILHANVVKVLTVHVSKGLESKNVLLYGNFPVKLPSWMQNTSNKKQTEEERRVFYVGATRSKENLIVLN